MKDDLISRQALIDAFEEEFYQMYSDDFNYMVNWIKNLPAAEPRRGMWEYVDYGGFGNFHCSECRMICNCNGNYNYCPNCGSRMTGDNE